MQVDQSHPDILVAGAKLLPCAMGKCFLGRFHCCHDLSPPVCTTCPSAYPSAPHQLILFVQSVHKSLTSLGGYGEPVLSFLIINTSLWRV